MFILGTVKLKFSRNADQIEIKRIVFNTFYFCHFAKSESCLKKKKNHTNINVDLT